MLNRTGIAILLFVGNIHSFSQEPRNLKFSIGLLYSKNVYLTQWSYSQDELKFGSIKVTNYTELEANGVHVVRKLKNYSTGLKFDFFLYEEDVLNIKILNSLEDMYPRGSIKYFDSYMYYSNLMEIPISYLHYFRAEKNFRPFLSLGLNLSWIYYENVQPANTTFPFTAYELERNKIDFYRTNLSFSAGFNIRIWKDISADVFADIRSPKITQTYSTLDRIRTSKICFGAGINYNFGKSKNRTDEKSSSLN